MKKKFLYILLAPALIGLFGCENNLDTVPQGDTVTDKQKEEVYANDPSKAAAGVNGIFAQFSTYMPNYDAIGSRHNDFGYPSVMMFTDANGYDQVQTDIGYNWAGNNLDYSDRLHTSRECQIIWNDMYAIIANSNRVIGAIDPETTEPLTKFYLAQGLAARSFSYWVLAQLFQFNYVGHETAACVPIVTDENSEIVAFDGAPRATVQEVYDLMLADLNTAIAMLEDAQDEGVMRADKRYIDLAVAYGLRARVNLTMHNYVAAAADATSAIDESSAMPAAITDVNKPSFVSVSEGNWMWGIIIAETDPVVTSGIVNYPSHLGSLNWGYAWYNGGRQINKKLFNSMPATDVRKGWFLDENLSSPNLDAEQAATMAYVGYPAYTHVKFAPYNNVNETSTNANDIPLMRIEEMHLIKAEAEAMSGGNGVTTLENFIKTYRDPDYVCPVSGTTAVQDEVWRHRRIEFWGEGMNWFDIMRLNKGVDRRGCGYPNPSMIFNIEAGDQILVWRLPEAEIQANKALEESDNNPSAPIPNPVPDVDPAGSAELKSGYTNSRQLKPESIFRSYK
ncbi:RagB/SusD family nutrient uptake outer membrane protein [Carboxylicivirga marina]|uniref:RagB/SusD family nutrient uptake outer membrane protein n=1 Tax=Carboxylicivirga marina TaxID=2800988 RepID=UPI002595FEDC|nr:RagB/SusD family nutrient uptake outer membrane protein [uncultured Carboxylicivirga sp.]